MGVFVLADPPWRLAGSNLGRIWGAEAPPSHPHPHPRSRPGAFPAHTCMRSRTARHYGLMHRGTILVSLSARRQHPRGVVRAGSSLSEQSRGSAAAAAPHPRDAHAAGATRRRGVQHHERRRRRGVDGRRTEQQSRGGNSSRALGSAEGSRSVSGPTIDAKRRGVLSGTRTTTTTYRSGTTARGSLHACAAQRRARSAARGGGAARGATEKIAGRGRRSPAAVRRASRGARGRGRRRGQKPLD